MPPSNWPSLRSALRTAGEAGTHILHGAQAGVPTSVRASAMLDGSVLGHRELRGRSVLLLVTDQLMAALALIELDGIARRIVLCPPDLAAQHLPSVMRTAGVDTVVSDTGIPDATPAGLPGAPCWLRASARPEPGESNTSQPLSGTGETCETEWVLLTSGTTGAPKLVVHTLASLAGGLMHAPAAASTPSRPVVWSTFYDIRRYGGLQIFLRALFLRTPLVLSDRAETPDQFLARAGSLGVTHISGTPSHWRRALMSPAAARIDPVYVRLSGEIADQAILNHLQSVYPRARVAHAFASTEAGLAFEVNDGLAGFPEDVLTRASDIELKIVADTLRVRSARTASRYLVSDGEDAPPLRDADGFVDTSDQIEQCAGRYCFVGRRDGVINVGGQKVHPEEVEAVLNRHPDVQMSLVWPKKSPITGALVVADVVLRATGSAASNPQPGNQSGIQTEILRFCRGALPAYKVPVSINVVSSLQVGASGKLERSHV